MDINREWEYYNHALIPTTAPHVVPDTSWMKDRKKWRELAGGKYPLFARWTTDFDCQEETEWWYLIKDAPFNYEDLSKNSKKHIRQALRNCKVERLNVREKHVDDLFRVYEEAYARYKKADNKITYDQFREGCLNGEEGSEYWAGYNLEGRLIGYIVTIVKENYVEISIAKFSSQYMNLRVSDALYYTVLDFYLNKAGKKYISSGERSINHATNTQEYKIKTFGFRKAYCRLHIKYNFIIGWIVYLLYPARNIVRRFDKNIMLHQLAGVLKMEEIIRKRT